MEMRSAYSILRLLSCFLLGFCVCHFDLSASFLNLFARSNEILDYLNKWGEGHPVDLVIVTSLGTIVASGILISVARLAQWLRPWYNPKPIDLFFRSQPFVHVVLPRMDDLQILRQDGGKQVMPRNAPLMATGDALAVSVIESYIERTFRGKKPVVFHHPGNVSGIRRCDNFVVIGGPLVNKMTHDVVEDGPLDFSVAVDPGDGKWKFWKTEQNGKKIVVRQAVLKGVDPSADVLVDYGAAVCLRDSAGDRQRRAFLFGIYPFGTIAAAEAFIGRITPKRNLREFAWLLFRNKDVVAIFKTEDKNYPQFYTTIESVGRLVFLSR